MLKKLLNFYLYRKFRIPEIDRNNAQLREQYDRFIERVTEYNQRYSSIMSGLIVNNPGLYNQIAELEARAKRIEHLSDSIEQHLAYGSNLIYKNILE